MIAGILREGGSFRLKRALWRVCLCSCVLLPASLGWTDEAPADQVHLFRSFPADRNRVYQGSPGSGGGHPLVCQLGNGEVLAVFQALGCGFRLEDVSPLWRPCAGTCRDLSVFSASQTIPREPTVKITDLQVFHMAGGHANWIFVKLYTDVGLTGVGESSMERHDPLLIRALESFRDFLVGKDPHRIELIWNSLYKQTFWYGQLIQLAALSGVEQALWDIKGKALGVPVHELLGGRLRDRVRAYANAWAFREVVTETKAEDTPESVARQAQAMVEQGFTAMKWDPFRDGGQVISRSEENYALESVQAVREAVGPDIDLLIECHGRFNMWSAIRMAHKLEPLDPFFYEEPIPPDNIDAMAEVQRSIRIPVATGERLYTRWDFRPLLEKQAPRIIQPDICHAGGILELKKIAAMAETWYVSVQPHNSQRPPVHRGQPAPGRLHPQRSDPGILLPLPGALQPGPHRAHRVPRRIPHHPPGSRPGHRHRRRGHPQASPHEDPPGSHLDGFLLVGAGRSEQAAFLRVHTVIF